MQSFHRHADSALQTSRAGIGALLLRRVTPPGKKHAAFLLGTFLMVLQVAPIAMAEDTDRLNDCVVLADAAAAAAKGRDAGTPVEKITEAILKENPGAAVDGELNAAISVAYANSKLSPKEASARVFETCFDGE